MIDQEQISECASKLGYYRDKYNANPDSIYFKFKLDQWKKKCEGAR